MSRFPTSLAVLTAIGAAGAAVPALAAGTGSSPQVTVAPRVGGPTTTFRVHLRVPAATGRFGLLVRRDVVTLSGHPAQGCLAGLVVVARPARGGARETIALSPGRHRTWCPGSFRGTVTQVTSYHCPSGGVACGVPAIRPIVLGRFSLRVVASSSVGSGGSGGSGSGGSGGSGSGGSGGSGSGGSGGPGSGSGSGSGGSGGSGGPSFAGLISVTYCAGGPVHAAGSRAVPSQLTYSLSWNAATDPSFSSSQIVYRIFVSSAPGGEDFNHPTAQSPPGATSDSLTEANPGAAPYFVVRAVDPAHLSDNNTIERRATNSCSNAN